MTFTRTYTHEERAWELALEASDPTSTEQQRETAKTELKEWLAQMPEESKKRVAGAARQVVYAPALSSVMPDV